MASEATHQRYLAVLLLSFSSGLPILLIGSTLQAWYTVAGGSLLTIGMLTMVGQPYVYKFFWAPFMDRYAPLGLDRRRGWIVLMQIGLVLGLSTMAFLNPENQPWILASAALIVGVFSASQDISIDAYRTDILNMQQRSFGAALNSVGYRLAMLFSGALALIMAAQIGWRLTYLIMAGLLLIEIGVTLWSPVPAPAERPETSLRAMIDPFKEFLSRENAIWLILFIIFYKLSEALALALNTTFLIRDIGFSLAEIGVIYKVVSLIGTLLGSVVGGALMSRLGLYRSLVYFGVLQAVANLSYMALSLIGKSYVITIAAVFTEYFCGALSTVAFVVFLMSLCNRRYTATQYAIFSALAAIGRVFVGPGAAVMVQHWGWPLFYFFTFLLGMPPLVLLWWMKSRINFMAEQLA